MVAKYDDECKKLMLNKKNTFNDNKDLNKVLFEENGIKPKKLNAYELFDDALLYTSADKTHTNLASVITKNALIGFGLNILNDKMQNAVVYYNLTIPSTAVYDADHVVAMAIDHKNKIIYYRDSHAADMRREIKDFLRKLLPDYKQDIDLSEKQQADVNSCYFTENNDNSCGLLTVYNLRDMYYKITGQTDKICHFTSDAARQNAWEILKDIQQEPEKPKSYTAVKQAASKLKINARKKECSTENLEKSVEKGLYYFNYRLYNEPNYEEIIDDAVKQTKNKHAQYLMSLKQNTAEI